MSGRWIYIGPADNQTQLISPSGELPIQIGGAQLTLMLRARRSQGGMLVLPHGRHYNAERLAARRLAARGLMRLPEYFGNPTIGYVYAHRLTELGKGAWLKVWSTDVRA